uniref:Uncharacterized protein n=1 Tax=Meloidogyne enterolobii TaxID=390850 RepID=A0A6V7V8Q6_MELEN|nr:unnamed protein product [Meloidogyne enterolobii]
MKLINVLILLIFNSIFWSLVNSVKNNKNQNELDIVEETSKDLNKILNDGAESSVAPQIQKNEDTINPKPKIAKRDKTLNNEEKRLKTNEYKRNYYKKKKENEDFKEGLRLYHKNYKQINKEKIREY